MPRSFSTPSRARRAEARQPNGTSLRCLPEVKDKASVVILIHEIFGLTDWAKVMADELGAQGFIVVAPDLLSGFGPNGSGSSGFPSQDASVKAVSALDPEVVTADLDAAADYGKHLPAAKVATVGFGWGGGKSFAFSTQRKDLSAAFVFHGQSPADVTSITAPIYGSYPDNDAFIGATLPATTGNGDSYTLRASAARPSFNSLDALANA